MFMAFEGGFRSQVDPTSNAPCNGVQLVISWTWNQFVFLFDKGFNIVQWGEDILGLGFGDIKYRGDFHIVDSSNNNY